MEQKNPITIKGKTLPYYPRILVNDGSEPRLNISVAKENLSIFKNIADKNNLPVFLMYGTLLGAVRERAFIAHDSDTDLTIHKKHEDILLEMIPELEKEGLLFVRYIKFTLFNKGSITYSFMKDEMWIDVYIMQKTLTGYIILGRKYPKRFFDKCDSIIFYNNEYLIPHSHENFLTYAYGPDWKTPKPGDHSSRVKTIFSIRLYIFLSRSLSSVPFVKNFLKKIARFITQVN